MCFDAVDATATTVEVERYQAPEVRDRPHRDPVGEGGFRPYHYQPADAVSPMVHYGDDVALRFTGSTHDEGAFITKAAETVNQLNTHLAAKIDAHRDGIELGDADLEEGARTLLLSYGVTAGAMREAVQRARAQGRKVSSLAVQSLWPVPETAIVNSFFVRKTARSIARVSSMILRYTGSRWPIVGALSAANTRDGTSLGPGPSNTRWGGSS